MSHRLAIMNQETCALRTLSHRLASAALGRMSPEAVRRIADIAVRPRWTAEALRRICARTGDESALAELVEQSGLVHPEGPELVLDPALALAGIKSREPSPAWLRAAAEELASAGDVVAATDLAIAAGAVEDAERLLGAHEGRLLQTASAGDLDRWLAAVGERSPALGSRLAALRARLTERLAPPAQSSPPGSRERTAPLFGRLARGLDTVRVLSVVGSIVVWGVSPGTRSGAPWCSSCSSPASRAGRTTGSPRPGSPWPRSCSCSPSARSTSPPSRAAGRSGFSSTPASSSAWGRCSRPSASTPG